MIYIENSSDNNNVLGVNDIKVIPEVRNPIEASQLWIKGEENAQGYFTLQNSKTLKFLTAISASGLEIKGG